LNSPRERIHPTGQSKEQDNKQVIQLYTEGLAGQGSQREGTGEPWKRCASKAARQVTKKRELKRNNVGGRDFRGANLGGGGKGGHTPKNLGVEGKGPGEPGKSKKTRKGPNVLTKEKANRDFGGRKDLSQNSTKGGKKNRGGSRQTINPSKVLGHH